MISSQDKALARRWLAAGAPESLWMEEDQCEWLWDCFVAPFGLCGCGRPEDVVKGLLRILEAFPRAGDTGRVDEALLAMGITPDSPAAEFMLHWFDHQGWTEHGGSVYTSWRSEEGEEFGIPLLQAWLERASND